MSAKNGKPCKRCGQNEWYANGHCAPCTRAYSLRWAKENPERHAANLRRWKKNNPEKETAKKRKWRHANPEKAAAQYRRWEERYPEKTPERNRRWQKNNPEKVAARNGRRRTLKTKAGGSYSGAEWKALIEHYGGKCLCCGRTDVKLTADHVVPVAKGGTSNIDNIQPLCQSCNSSKNDRAIDYRPDKGLGRWVQDKLFTGGTL